MNNERLILMKFNGIFYSMSQYIISFVTYQNGNQNIGTEKKFRKLADRNLYLMFFY